MKHAYLVIVTFLTLGTSAVLAQTKKMETKNPLLCDIETGTCEVPTHNTSSHATDNKQHSEKAVKVIYYTDPICSSCWAIEPQLRKLKLEYGENLEIEYRMGGLLPDWSYNSGGISKPSDVAHHWDEVSIHYDMPIDGDVWLQDPLSSSYPASIAFKAAQMQDPKKAILFLREVREMVFLHRKNIAKWENLAAAAEKIGLNTAQFKSDYEQQAKVLFEDDLKLGKELGARGFPMMFFSNKAGATEIVYGSKGYQVYENAVLKLAPGTPKHNYDKSWEAVFEKYTSLTAKEFSELTGTPRQLSEVTLDELAYKGILNKHTTKNGSIWTIKH